jgi:hypothetical protein
MYVCRLKREAYQNMATENGPYNTIGTIHSASEQITQKFKTAKSSLWSVYSNAESTNT